MNTLADNLLQIECESQQEQDRVLAIAMQLGLSSDLFDKNEYDQKPIVLIVKRGVHAAEVYNIEPYHPCLACYEPVSASSFINSYSC